MLKAWKFLLRRDLPANSLRALKFTIFGLGDSSYALFNAMAKKLAQRLLDLGANLFHKVGLGDYQHDFGYEGEFDPWLAQLWPNLKLQLPPVSPMLLEPTAEDDQNVLPPVYRVEVLATNSDRDLIQTLDCLENPLGAVSEQGVSIARVLENTKLTADGHFQDTRKISLAFPSAATSYVPGDVLMILPKNDD